MKERTRKGEERKKERMKNRERKRMSQKEGVTDWQSKSQKEGIKDQQSQRDTKRKKNNYWCSLEREKMLEKYRQKKKRRIKEEKARTDY